MTHPQTALSPRPPDRCGGERVPCLEQPPSSAPGPRTVEPAPVPGAQAIAPGPGETGAIAPKTASPTGGYGLASPSVVDPGVGRRQTAPNDRAGLEPACPVVRAERADGASAAKREREARLAAYNGVIEIRLPVSPRTETHQERVAEYRRLTRDLGLARKAAQRRLGISLATVQNYERAITGLTGTQRRQQLQARHAELLAQGLNHIEIGRRLGIHRRTSMAWARLREAT